MATNSSRETLTGAAPAGALADGLRHGGRVAPRPQRPRRSFSTDRTARFSPTVFGAESKFASALGISSLAAATSATQQPSLFVHRSPCEKTVRAERGNFPLTALGPDAPRLPAGDAVGEYQVVGRLTVISHETQKGTWSCVRSPIEP